MLFASKSNALVINNTLFKCRLTAQSKSSMALCSQANPQSYSGKLEDLNMPKSHAWSLTTSLTTGTPLLTKWPPTTGTALLI